VSFAPRAASHDRHTASEQGEWHTRSTSRIVTGSTGSSRPVALVGRQSSMDQPLPVVVRWLAAGDSGDVEAFDDLLHGDVVVHAPRGLSSADLESEKQVWRDALSAMPDLRHDVQEVLAQANVEMARVIVTGTLRHAFGGVSATGRPFRMDQAVVCHLYDGKISEAWEIADVGSLTDQ
jgi:ketosteroid isomerase-like protein